ncbi:hypothetical protein OROHE_015101 [Orobanche hederae]
MGGDMSALLPVLYVEDGKEILQSFEIIGVHEPLKKGGKRDYQYVMPRERYKSMDASKIVEEDEEDFMKAPCQDCSWMRQFHRKSDVFGPSVECDSVKPRTVLESGKIYLEAAENIKGDQQHFVRREKLKGIDNGESKSVPYKRGSRGPEEAGKLLEKAGYIKTHGYIRIPPTL